MFVYIKIYKIYESVDFQRENHEFQVNPQMVHAQKIMSWNEGIAGPPERVCLAS